MLCPWCHTENPDGAQACGSCGQSLAPIRIGSVIANRYEILESLGKGGMGMVYRARDRTLDDIVALKVLRPDVVTPEMAKRFRAEIRLARKITHKNVCRIHEYGEDGPWRYISMAFVEGTDLKNRLRRMGPLSPQEALAAAVGVAEALAAIHDEGIVHRDVKTQNIMLDKKGVVKVMDFGIAKLLESNVTGGLTGTGLIVGTPEYMSPEQARGEKVDFRSDLFSLGVVMFELFTADLPFRADTPIATLMKLIGEPPPLDGPKAARIPPVVLPVLAKALEKDPGQRFQSAEQMVEALKQAKHRLDSSPVAPIVGSTIPATEPSFARPTPVPTAVPTRAPTPVPTAIPTERRTRSGAANVPPPIGATVGVRTWLGLPPWLAVVVVIAVAVATAASVAVVLIGRRLESRQTTAPAPAATTPAPSTAPVLDSNAAVRLPPPSVPSPMATALPRLAEPSTATPRASAPIPSALPSTSQPIPGPKPPPSTTPTPVAEGILRVVAIPWADVTVDEVPVPALNRIPLAVGPHTVRLVHPDYEPLQRKVTIKAGETLTLTVDLPEDAVKKRR